MSQHEIYITYMDWGASGKSRPVLAFILNESTVDVYQITTQYEGKSEEIKSMYFKINDWVQAGLDKPSYIDTITLITLSMDTFKGKKPIGKLTEADKLRLLEFLGN